MKPDGAGAFWATTLAVALPIPCGAAFQQGLTYLGAGIGVTAALAGVVAFLAYLSQPGAFQRVDIERRKREEMRRDGMARRGG